MIRRSSLSLALLLGACGTPPLIEPDAGRSADASVDSGIDAGPATCPGSSSCPACSNGIDDDGDDLVDYPLDPGCARREDDDESEPPPPGPCANDADDDHDGKIDYPEDPGCADEEDLDETDPPPPACVNGADDDGDGATDYPDDPGCASARDTDESDACPGAGCPACANGADDDGDDDADYPMDAECESASDDDERCAVIGSFDGEWPGPWADELGNPIFMSTRRGAAAHDGPYGLIDPLMLIVNPTIVTGADGDTASVWVKALQDPTGVIHALHFAISDTGSYACMLDLAGELVVYAMPRSGESAVLETTAAPRERDVWYRLEVAFMASNVAECRLYAEGGTAPLATVAHTFDGPLTGPVGIRGASLSAFDTVEVCR